ncbi:MAG: xanthine dehydrogenase family protein molybdopterin-binding subunit [Vicinamibacterales bacterium]
MATNYKYIGHNYTTPDLVAKVTGKARYAEDHRAEGMLFVKLLLSPMPHARVTGVDASRALALPGVKAILRASDFPPPPAPPTPPGGQAPPPPPLPPEIALTDEPVYQGEPILAIAAVDEATAAEAIELVNVTYEPLPFVTDPLDSLRPGGPNARTQGNVYTGAGPTLAVANVKWTLEDFADAAEGRLPMGEAPDTFTFGDLEAGFKAADLILDESILSQGTGHQPLETRTAMAYWQNGKLYLYGSTQSVAQTVPNIARLVGITPEEVVLVSEYTGGGFGSKIPGSHSMAIPALMAKKTGTPVMMRITREEEHYIGRARAGIQGRCKIGFRKDGKILAMDFFTIQDNGPYNPQGDHRSAGSMATLTFQPEAYRWRGISVLTNTPPRTSQRSPGGMQMNAIIDPIMAQAAKKLGIDHVELLKINAPVGKAPYGPVQPATKRQAYVTQANVREALDQGAALFNWAEKKATVSGQRRGTKVRGIGVAVGPYTAGSIGFDGLAIVRPDGKVQVQTGIGNLGTESVFDCQRVYAEVLDTPWEQFEVVWGNTERGLPWSCVSAGSQTVHAMTRAAHAGATALKANLQEVAARALGGSAASYQVANGRVFSGGRSLSFADAARKAIEYGGKFDGHEGPEDINVFTKRSLAAVAGQGLVGVAKDTYKRDGNTHSFVAGFAEVEVDVETGAWHIVEYAAVGDVGTILHPRNLFGQTFGGSMLGIGHALSQKWVYDKQYGVALARRFHHNKPPTIMDIPRSVKIDATNIPDPETPVGARGIGEPPVGAGCGAVAAALVDALGAEAFRRMPITPDLILTSIEAKTWQHDALTAHI